MKLNKKLAKTLVFAMALGAVPFLGANTTKAADKPEGSHLTLQVAVENFKVTGDKAKFWAVAKHEKNEKNANLKLGGEENYKVTDVYPIIENLIDLSSFPKNKQIIIAVGSTETPDAENWIVKKIEPASKTFAFEYVTTLESAKKVSGANDAKALGNAEVGYFVAGIDKDTVADLSSADVNTKIEVQEGDGAWANLAAFLGAGTDEKAIEKLKVYTATGKSLKFRLKKDNSWNSNVVTVKIPVLPAAPKVKFDPAKGTVSTKDNMEWKMHVASAEATAYKDATKNMSLYDTAGINAYGDTGLGVKGGTFTVRTKANGKKLASKEAVYTITKQDAPTINKVEDAQSVEIIKVEANNKELVTASLNVKYDFKKGAQLINSESNEYEYFLSWSGTAPTPTTKWKKLAAAKKKGSKLTPAKVALKYSETDKVDTYGGDNTKIYIRRAGKKQDGNNVTLASKEASNKFKFAKIEQAFTAPNTGAVNNFTTTSATVSTFAVTTGKEATGKLTLQLTNLQNAKKNPKLKVTDKVSGVSVKAGKFKVSGDNHTVDITIKVSKSAFKTAGNGTLKFDLTIEGAKVSHTCTINATAPVGA